MNTYVFRIILLLALLNRRSLGMSGNSVVHTLAVSIAIASVQNKYNNNAYVFRRFDAFALAPERVMGV